MHASNMQMQSIYIKMNYIGKKLKFHDFRVYFGPAHKDHYQKRRSKKKIFVNVSNIRWKWRDNGVVIFLAS